MANALANTLDTNLYSSGINLGGTLLNNYLQGQSLDQIQNQTSGALNAAGQYVQGASQQANNILNPYVQSGYNALPGMQTAIQNMSNPYTLEQFNASGYGQASDAALKQQLDQIRAQSAQVGQYGSGNMANALTQNALTTKLGAYDTANKANLNQNNTVVGALYNQAGMGQASAQNVANNYLKAGDSMANLAIGQGQSAVNNTVGKNALSVGNLTSLASLAQTALAKYKAGQQLTPQETLSLQTNGAASDYQYVSNPANFPNGDNTAAMNEWLLQNGYTGLGTDTTNYVDPNSAVSTDWGSYSWF